MHSVPMQRISCGEPEFVDLTPLLCFLLLKANAFSSVDAMEDRQFGPLLRTRIIRMPRRDRDVRSRMRMRDK